MIAGAPLREQGLTGLVEPAGAMMCKSSSIQFQDERRRANFSRLRPRNIIVFCSLLARAPSLSLPSTAGILLPVSDIFPLARESSARKQPASKHAPPTQLLLSFCNNYYSSCFIAYPRPWVVSLARLLCIHQLLTAEVQGRTTQARGSAKRRICAGNPCLTSSLKFSAIPETPSLSIHPVLHSWSLPWDPLTPPT